MSSGFAGPHTAHRMARLSLADADGRELVLEGSSRSIAAAMRRGITKYGPPECVYVDNGKDYRKVGKGATPGYMMESPLAPQDWRKAELESIEATGFLARVGTALTHCAPYHGQAKHIERFWAPSTSTSINAGRHTPQQPLHASRFHFTRDDGTPQADPPWPRCRVEASQGFSLHRRLPGLDGGICGFASHGIGMDGGTPRQVFENNLNPNQRPAPDPATLAL